MTLLNSAALWGLLALAVPIIIHFFNLQRPRQILFSNVAFVREVKKSVVRRLKFRQWLLLLARLLAIAGLVLAFSNPVIVDPDTQKVMQGNRSIALVIDNSYSMTAGNEKGNYLQQSISLARNIFRTYSRQDEFLLMTTSDIKLNYNFGEQEEVLEELKSVKVRQDIHPHSDLLELKDEIFSRASNNLRELYFLSDFQRSTVMADSQIVTVDDSALLIKYIPLASRAQKNVYIEKTQIVSQIIEKNKPVEMSLLLVNDGNTNIKDLSIRVMLEGKAVAISNKSIDAQAKTELNLTFTPSKSGWVGGYIELDDNPIDFDNRRYFSLYVPDKEKVLIVEGQRSENIRILYGDLTEQFETEFVSARNISSVQFSDYQSLVLLGIEEVSSGLAGKLKDYLQEGGGILLFPGEKLNPESINLFFSTVSLGQMLPRISLQEGQIASEVDLAHPIFEGVFQSSSKRKVFDGPLVKQYHPLRLNNQSIHNRIMAMENGDPILIESRIENGLLYTFSIYPGDQWTDFHVKTIFPPVLFRISQILNQTQNVQSGQEIGFYKPKRVRTQAKTLIYLQGENGQAIPPEQYPKGGATTLIFDQMEILEGNYNILQDGEVLEKISFNISDLESRLDFVPQQSLREQLDQKGYQNIQILPPLPDSIQTSIRTEKEGTPLWKYFLIAAIIFLAFEIGLLVWDKGKASQK